MILPKDLKDVKAIRDFYTQQRQALCSMAECLEEPWKSHYMSLKGEYDKALEALPPTDQAPAAIDANRTLSTFCSLLLQCNSINSMMGAHMQSLKSQSASAFNSAVDAEIKKRIDTGILVPAAEVNSRVNSGLEAAVAAELDRRIKAGELMTKDTATNLASQSRENGLKEGREALQKEINAKEAAAKVAEGRKAKLATAGLPIPDKDIVTLLGGTDEEFAKRQQEAESRLTGLKKKNSALNSKNPIYQAIWLPADQWKVYEQIISDVLSGGPAPEPLAGPGGNDKKELGPVIV